MAYAEGTSVSASKSQADIGELVRKHGATGFQFGYDERMAMVMFKSHARLVRFTIEMPDPSEKRFHYTPGRNQRRSPKAAADAYDAEQRRRWRSLHMTIKAKLVAIEDQISDFEQEFLAHIVMPGGQTVYEMVQERIDAAYESGDPVELLPRYTSNRQLEAGPVVGEIVED